MIDNIPFNIVTPSKTVLDEEAFMVVIPSVEGDIAIMDKRMPIMLALQAGGVYVFDNNQKLLKSVFVHDGFASWDGKKLVILTDDAVDFVDVNKSDLIESINKDKADITSFDEESCEYKLKLATIKAKEKLIFSMDNPSYR